MDAPPAGKTTDRTRHRPPASSSGGGGLEVSAVSDGTMTHSHGSTPVGEEQTPILCPSCGGEAHHLVRSYWGPYLCPECCAGAAADMDADGTWPAPWWEERVPAHILVLGDRCAWHRNKPWQVVPSNLAELGALCERFGVTQVWVHRSALAELGLPEMIHHTERSRTPFIHPWTRERGDWVGRGLAAWGYWYRKGGHGFDLHVPAYGRAVWAECDSAPELAARVAMFDRATGGVAWKGNGTITSDVYLRRRLRKALVVTEHPEPVASGQAHEVPAILHREPEEGERGYRYVHALDLNLAYASGASSVPLPTGPCEHREGWPRFDAKLAGVYFVEEGDRPRWVTAPTMERLDAAGVHALEAYVWPASRRHLRPWYEMVRDARATLLEDGGPALTAVKDVCREGLGRMASKARTIPEGRTLADDPTYQPYWAWAVIAEVRERLLAGVAELPVQPVAIDTDCLYFLSSRHSPSHLALHLGLPLGDGLGQFKPAGTCLASKARVALAEPRTSRAVAALRELCQ
jgi:hypothetical protein